MVAEKGVSVHEIKVTLVGVREALRELHNVLGSIKAQEASEPTLDWVVAAISDWLIQLYLL